jgi:hypothetical protein
MSKSSLIVLSKLDVFWTGHNVSRPKCTHEQVPAKEQNLDMMSAHLHPSARSPRALQMTRRSKPCRRKTRRKAGQKKRENQLSPCITSISVDAAVWLVTIDPFCFKTDD